MQELPLMSLASFTPKEFDRLRRRNINRYKAVCRYFVSSHQSKNFLLKMIIGILNRQRDDRIEEEIALIMKATSEFQFFHELNSKSKNVEHKLHMQCCYTMTYQFFKKGDIIMKFGDPGDKFYIIIDGNVNVYLPRDSEEVDLEAARSREQYNLLDKVSRKMHPIAIILKAKKTRIRNKMTAPFHFISMMKKRSEKRKLMEQKKIQRSVSIHSDQDNSLDDLNEDVLLNSSSNLHFEQIDIAKDIKAKEEQLFDAQRDQSILKITTGILPQHFSDIEFFFKDGVFKHKCITELKSGMMFGELGLLMNKPRSASIVAQTNTQVAKMTAIDYKRILKEAELQKIEDKISFFMSSFFQNVPKNIVIKNYYSFTRKKFQRGIVIYNENKPIDGVYLIKKGQLEVYKQVNINDPEIIQRLHLQQADSQEDLIKTFTGPPNLLSQQQRMKQISIANLDKGQMFGEIEIFQKVKERQFSLRVISDSATLYYISQNSFHRTMQDLPALRQLLYHKFKLKVAHQQQILANMIDHEGKMFIQKMKQSVNHSKPSVIKNEFCSTKNVIDQLKFKVKKQREIGNHFGFKTMDMEFVQKFQEDLIELQVQNSQLNSIMRRQIYLLPKGEREKLHSSSQANLKIRQLLSQTSVEEFVDLKKVLNYKLQQKSKSSVTLTEESLVENTKKDTINERISTQESLRIMSYGHNKISSFSKRDGGESFSRIQPPSNIAQRLKPNQSPPVMDIVKNSVCHSRQILTASKHNQFRQRPSKEYLIKYLYK